LIFVTDKLVLAIVAPVDIVKFPISVLLVPGTPVKFIAFDATVPKTPIVSFKSPMVSFKSLLKELIVVV